MLWGILNALSSLLVKPPWNQVNKKDGVTINWYGAGGKAANPDVNEAESIRRAWEHAKIIAGWTM